MGLIELWYQNHENLILSCGYGKIIWLKLTVAEAPSDNSRRNLNWENLEKGSIMWLTSIFDEGSVHEQL